MHVGEGGEVRWAKGEGATVIAYMGGGSWSIRIHDGRGCHPCILDVCPCVSVHVCVCVCACEHICLQVGMCLQVSPWCVTDQQQQQEVTCQQAAQ